MMILMTTMMVMCIQLVIQIDDDDDVAPVVTVMETIDVLVDVAAAFV